MANLNEALSGNADVAVIVFDKESIVYISNTARALFSSKHQNLSGSEFNTIHQFLLSARENGRREQVWQYSLPDSNVIELNVQLTSFDYNENLLSAVLLTQAFQTATLSDELNELTQKLSLHIDRSPLGVIDWDTEFRVKGWNAAAEKIFGFSSKEAIGQHASILIPPEYHHHVDAVWKDLLKKEGGEKSYNENITKDGIRITCEWFNTAVVDNKGNVQYVSSLVQDVTDRERYLKTLQYQARHDSLTQLYNRVWLVERIDEMISTRPDNQFSLLFIDINNFKEINDTLGHGLGDDLLITIGDRLNIAMGETGCQIARLGGDEFAVIITGPSYGQAINSVQAVLNEPLTLNNMSIIVDAGIGVVSYPAHGNTASKLMRCADIAMYHAKNSQSEFIEFSQDIDTFSEKRLALMSDLRTAINQDQLLIHYQPKIDISKQQLVGFEALLRWKHPELDMIPPADFIPYAEVTQIIHPMTMWVVRNVLEQAKRWLSDGLETQISINLSATNLHDENLPRLVAELLQEYSISPEMIEFEITESAMMKDPRHALANLNKLHDLGVQLSIDDYGTGYSSLAYIKKLPIQKLKIDRSFIFGMASNKEERIIVESTIGLAHNLGLKVVAEGVEDKKSLNVLKQLGCDEAQGYYIARPLHADQLRSWLAIRDQTG